MDFLTQPIAEGDQFRDFDCGTEELNRFLRVHALENDRRGIGRTFLLRSIEPNLPRVAAFYTLSMAGIDASSLPRKERQHLPKYPLPVALIGRLAVDRRFQTRGLGKSMLLDAFLRVLAAADCWAAMALP